MKNVFKKRNFYILGALFIFALFFYMTYQTPLAGDDWGYALGKVNPIARAFAQYQSWSGRFFSELWGYVVAPRKWLWNFLNPLLFTLIFVGIYYLCNIQNKPISSVILLLAMMLNVANRLRMETYTWIMGDTYVVPLCLSIWYFVIIRKLVSTRLISGKLKAAAILTNVFLFIIGLMMENIAAMMIVAIIILIIYAILTRKYLIKYLVPNLIVSVVSFIIMRLSPGSNARLLRDNPEFAALSIFEKIFVNYETFIEQTFTKHYYTISIFAFILLVYLIIEAKKKNTLLRYSLIVIQFVAIFSSFSFVLGDSFLNNPSSLYSKIFWPLYVASIFVMFLTMFDYGVLKERTIFYLLIAGGSALVMLASPIYGPRSSIYLVYYLIIVTLIVFDHIKTNRSIGLILFIFFLALTLTRSYRLIKKYHLVGLRDKERMEVIEYYKSHPEDKDVFIPRMPIESVHSADVEADDLYHMEVFKAYYELPQDFHNIQFYYVVDK